MDRRVVRALVSGRFGARIVGSVVWVGGRRAGFGFGFAGRSGRDALVARGLPVVAQGGCRRVSIGHGRVAVVATYAAS